MKANVPEGKYILAVSGGVDSMTLLDLLAGRRGIELVAAHFNHGIREDSDKDEKLVTEASKRYGLPLEADFGGLGTQASEETARNARYRFLNQAKKKHQADKIITAHHQDDLIETAFLNILRGTGSRGLTAMQNNPDILRPLLDIPKAQIIEYARQKRLVWREDPTNQDLGYMRNYLRHKIIPRLSKKEREEIIQRIDNISATEPEREQLIGKLSQSVQKSGAISRRDFISLPLEVEYELMAYWLRQQGINQFDKKTLERLSMAAKTAPAGTIHEVRGRTKLILTAKTARFETSVV
jgi:tRNA(Ile)-lysidine synthase